VIPIRNSTPLVVLTCAGLLTAWSLVAFAGQVREHDPEWVVPQAASSRANPLTKDPKAEAGGRRLFAAKCATCHGPGGRGTVKAPNLTAPAAQAQTDGALFWKIGSGNTRKGMPSFSFLPEAQRRQLVLHLRALAESH
jgi:mono/diheme cytochrome c family protein